jgi:Uma2 family endonuclease
MATALKLPRTLDEFLEWERRQEERWEFSGGQLRLMSGGTGDHAQIAANILIALGPRLRGSGCQVFGSDLKLLVQAMQKSYYPDVMVRCGRPVGQEDTIDDTVVLFEVLSKGTAEYNLTTKRKTYETVPTI